ncbi:hypothetical protein V5799_030419 [Amblyomma americanum]|uniref:Uncharacterized protein n=1 Tax=Amblyomma americanum TaxID=6943 RepID=A0AAQ4ENU3_AMBAM
MLNGPFSSHFILSRGNFLDFFDFFFVSVPHFCDQSESEEAINERKPSRRVAPDRAAAASSARAASADATLGEQASPCELGCTQ